MNYDWLYLLSVDPWGVLTLPRTQYCQRLRNAWIPAGRYFPYHLSRSHWIYNNLSTNN